MSNRFKKISSSLLILSFLVTGTLFSPLPPVNAAVPPTITSPTNNQVFSNYPRRFELKWNTVANVNNYTVSIECDLCKDPRYDGFWPEVANFTTGSTSYTYDALPIDTTYRVRVRANYSNGENAWSEYQYFRFATLNLPTPTLQNPTANQVITAPTPAVTWTSVPQATRYALQWECKTCGGGADWSDSHFIDTNTAVTNYLLTLPQTANDYRVRIQAIDIHYNRSVWSDYTYFRYTTGTPGTTLPNPPTITRPQSNDVITAASVNISWNALAGASTYDVELICADCSISEANNDPDKIIYRAYGTNSTSLTITLPSLNRHFTFRVKGKATDGAQSPWATVNFETASTSNLATTITYPTNGQIIQNNDRSVDITWQAVPGATDYQLVVDCANCSNYGPLPTSGYFTGIQGTSKTLQLASFKNYTVMVRPRFGTNAYGAIGPWATVTFELRGTIPNPPPTTGLAITAPFNGQRISQTSRQISSNWQGVPTNSQAIVFLECNSCSAFGSGWQMVTPYIAESGTTTTTFTLPEGNRRYRLRIWTPGTDQSYGKWSAYNTFTFVQR